MFARRKPAHGRALTGRLSRALSFAAALGGALASPLLPSVAAAACVSNDHDALLIFDASYSMLRQIENGVSRFQLARQSINDTLDVFPDNALVALRLYGSNTPAQRMDCSDTVLKVPFAPAATNRGVIKTVLAGTHARGVTPIAFALKQAAEDFPSTAPERIIVLLSDGGEDCGGDPCAVAADLHMQGFVINTLGLFTDPIGYRQLQCIARVSGGQFFHVEVPVQLTDRLMQAMGICPIALGPARREASAFG